MSLSHKIIAALVAFTTLYFGGSILGSATGGDAWHGLQPHHFLH